MHAFAVVIIVLVASCSDNDSPVPDAQAPMCPAAGPAGAEPGDIVYDALVRRCDGTEVSLHELICGPTLTLLDLGGAAFAECVAATDEYATDPAYDALQARGLQIVQVFVADEDLDPPTSLFCREYSEAHAVDFEFHVDPLRNTSALAEQYPFNVVIDSEGRIIHRWALDIPDDKLDILSALLP